MNFLLLYCLPFTEVVFFNKRHLS